MKRAERLDKLICIGTGVSRQEAKKLVKEGKVNINGNIIKDPNSKVDPDDSVISVNGQELMLDEYIYVMLNKPEGYVSATEDRTEKTVLDLLPENLQKRKLFPVGRLDKDTTGLLILTDDGELGHRLTSPKYGKEKVYSVETDRTVSEEEVKILEKGIKLRDGLETKPALISDIKERNCKITITEGKYHQVKRMFASLGLHVEKLERVKMDGIILDKSLDRGQWRFLTNEEKATLKNA